MEDTFKTVTLENLESEHICCMIAEKKGKTVWHSRRHGCGKGLLKGWFS